MAVTTQDAAGLSAKIVYWGAQGSGKTTNLRLIHSKLRPDNRGDLKRVPAPLDPSASWEVMPIELGDLGGVRTRLEVVAVPGGPEHAPTRKQLLDRVDGIVFVVDAKRERLDENLAAFEELRTSLAAYGRGLADVPLVVQYNKRDLADPYALEELHRKLDMRGAAAFEAVASEGTGVLPTLTTISKGVMRVLRERVAGLAAEGQSPAAAARSVSPAPAPTPAPQAAAPERAPAPAPATPPVPSPRPLPAPSTEVAFSDAAAAAAATVTQAQALFEPGFVRARSGAPLQEGAEPVPLASTSSAGGRGDWQVASVGEPSRADGCSVRLPVVLRDENGRTAALTITLRFDGGALEVGD